MEILENEMNLPDLEHLSEIEVPFVKQSFYNKEGKKFREFTSKDLEKNRHVIKRFERALLHEKLYNRVHPLIHDFKFKSTIKNVKLVSESEKQFLRVHIVDKDGWMHQMVQMAENIALNQPEYSQIVNMKQRLGVVVDWMEKQKKKDEENKHTFDDAEEDHFSEGTENDIDEESVSNERNNDLFLDSSSVLNFDNVNNSGSQCGNSGGCSAPTSKRLSFKKEDIELDIDLLIGSDGINSFTRDHLFNPERESEFSPHTTVLDPCNDDHQFFKAFLNVGYMCFIIDLVRKDVTGKSSMKTSTSVDSLGCASSFVQKEGQAKQLKLSHKLFKLLEDHQMVNVLLDQGRYFYCQRNGDQVYVTCMFSQQLEQDNDSEEEQCTKSSDSNKTTFKRRRQIFIPAEERKAFLLGKFSDCKYIVRDLIELVTDSKTIYYDDVSQTKIPTWHLGSKVVLSGDSAHGCTPLSGKGGSIAMIGAKILACELRYLFRKSCSEENGQIVMRLRDGDVEQAFINYEKKLRDRVNHIQEKTIKEAKFLLANSVFKQLMRNQMVKFLPKSFLLNLSKKDTD